MSRSIDHLVLPVHDLAAAASFYRRLGFSVSARNQHPFGTENHIVRLENSYLELLGLAEGGHERRGAITGDFSFPGFVETWLDQREGIAMVALATGDAAADARAFHAAGIGDAEPFCFERSGKGADGTDVLLGFALAFAHSPLIHAAGFFTCEHIPRPPVIDTAILQHENSALRLAGIVMLAENPSVHAEFLGEWLDQRMMLATSMGVEMEAGPAQRVEVVTAAAAHFRLGEASLSADAATRFIAYRIVVADMDKARRCLRRNGITFSERPSALVVPPSEAFGATITFELG